MIGTRPSPLSRFYRRVTIIPSFVTSALGVSRRPASFWPPFFRFFTHVSNKRLHNHAPALTSFQGSGHSTVTQAQRTTAPSDKKLPSTAFTNSNNTERDYTAPTTSSNAPPSSNPHTRAHTKTELRPHAPCVVHGTTLPLSLPPSLPPCLPLPLSLSLSLSFSLRFGLSPFLVFLHSKK